MANNELHDFDCIFLRSSDQAALLRYEGEEAWVPFSQMENPSIAHDADVEEEVTITIPEWLAEKKGWL